jgi:hypothetical protein
LLFPLLVLATGCALGGEGLPPTVFTTTPAHGSGNVPVTAGITAIFSSPMDSTTITAGSFTLTQGEIPIPGSVTCSGKSATFTPESNLAGNAVFTATITTSAKDAAGVAVASNQVWTFMTVPALTAGSIALYYTHTFGVNPWTRSSSPVTLTNGANVVSQSANPDGSVTLTIANASGYEDNGFYFYVGTLQFLSSLRVVGSGTGIFTANLYLDVDNDGEFFTWGPPNVFSAVGADLYYTGPSAVNGVLTIDATTVFGGHTLPQLRSGVVGGVNPNTRAGIWIGISVGSGSQTTTIVSVRQNG